MLLSTRPPTANKARPSARRSGQACSATGGRALPQRAQIPLCTAAFQNVPKDVGSPVERGRSTGCWATVLQQLFFF